MNEPLPNTARFLSRFLQTGARVVLVGGVAAVALGVPYLTQDIDFCYDTNPDNRARLLEALAPLQPRLRVERMPDEAARLLQWRWDDRALRGAPNLTLQTDAGPIDPLSEIAGLGRYTEVLQEALTLQVAGLEIPVLDLPGLLKAKRAAGRAKDMAVLPLIEATLLERAQQQEEQGSDDSSASGKGEPAS
jgi:hypothetical protein